MKARVKATGEIVEVHTCDDADFVDRKGKYYWEHDLFFGSLDTFPYEDPDYWTLLEHTYAGMAMQGILSNPELFKATAKNAEEFGLIVPQAVAIDANCFAHALIQKLKGKEESK